MPFINVKVNTEVSTDKETEIKTALGSAISCIRGKSEAWLMVGIEDKCRLYFRGDGQTPAAFVEVKIYGSASRNEYEKKEKTDLVFSGSGRENMNYEFIF